jgi:SAM-dependent methyltransferase
MNKENLDRLAKLVGTDWTAGPYYDDAEKGMDAQWSHFIWPHIEGSDFSCVVDLAAGHGRNTAKLLTVADVVYAVDINQENIDFMSKRFGPREKLRLIKNNGYEIPEIGSGSVSFVYSFDAMVHFDSDVVRNYIHEFRRIMRPGARGFCHYSNYTGNPTGSYRDHPGWRNFMSRALFEHWIAKAGFRVLKSHYLRGTIQVSTDDKPDADAITLFELPPTP